MENKRVFISNQLCCMLPPTVFKVFFYICGWSKNPQFKYYPSQMSKMLHLTVQEVELAIQTLIDRKLLTATNVDGNWILEVERQQVEKYLTVPLQKVHDSEVFQMAKEVTWNVEEKEMPKKFDDIEGLSPNEISSLILRLQASLNEKQQLKKKVVYVTPNNDDLPF